MMDYGSPPAADEIEVTLFGPGYGEAVAVHLGGGAWILIDSCIEPTSKEPASGHYLNKIGITSDQVRAIVASHWHDDHVRGISDLATRFSNANFVISGVFAEKDAAAFLSAYGGITSSGITGGAKELYKVVSDRPNVSPALHKSIILDGVFSGRSVLVTSLSPVPAAFSQFVADLAQYLPRKGGAINHAPEIRPNFESIVLHIDLGDDAILLGSDLEEHGALGWTAVAADRWSGGRREATVYKVAHHGSESGDSQDIWEKLLNSNPIACMTPWVLAGNRLPTADDENRIKELASRAYISSGASRSPKMDRGQLKRLQDIAGNVQLVDSGFGAVRLRKKIGESVWETELFGAAKEL